MCIIVDANAIHDLKEPTEDGIPVLKWLLGERGGLVVGGKAKTELAKSEKLRSMMAALNQAGRLHDFDITCAAKIAAAIEAIKPQCKSNDPHILAVALVSGCRLIFSRDKDLHTDAQNRDILNPAASIYQKKNHGHLLKECRCPKAH